MITTASNQIEQFERNLEKAADWYIRSAKQGYAKARKKLNLGPDDIIAD